MASTRNSVAAAVMAVVVCAGCTTGSEPASQAQQAGDSGAATAEGWAPFVITADEVESFDTLDQMAAASDAVIRGRFVEALPDRVVQGDASEDRVAYARAAFAVDEAIAGKSTPAVIIVELLTNGDTAEVPIAETQVLLFAHEKLGKGEAGVFRPITSNGLLVEDEGARVSAPLAEDSDRTLEWITTEIGGSTLTLERVVAEIS